jgi:tRNA 2-thiocytidine biosynthesis protein TtcA
MEWGENFEKQKKFFDKHEIPHSFQETEIFDLAKTKINKNSSFCSFFF